MSLHPEAYSRASKDILIEMDAELEKARRSSTRLDTLPTGIARGATMSSVSIIIPCFNLGEFLPEAVRSAREQTRPPNEIIIVDDGSTDEKTLKALDRCRAVGGKVLRTVNQGVSAARNFGIAQAQSKYILCLDADDVLMPRYLEETVPVLDARTEVGIVATHVEFFGQGNGVWQPPPYNLVRLLWHNCIPSASLFRRVCWEETGGYRNLKVNEDWSFWIGIVAKGWKWGVVEKILYRYRKRQGSRSEEWESENRKHLFRQSAELHPEIYKRHYLDGLVELESEWSRMCQRLGKHEMATGDARKISHLAKSSKRARGQQMQQHVSAAGTSDLVLKAQLENLQDQLAALQSDCERRDQVDHFRKMVRTSVPAGAKILVVSKGDADLLDLEDRSAGHFPQMEEGVYAGFHPGNSEEAIAHLEDLRAQGSDYLVFPSSAMWWLEHYTRFQEHLEQRYTPVMRQDACAIFRLCPRTEPLKHTFSVVICTYKRAAFLGKAIKSLFQQDYPKDKFEIIIINNNSPDETEEVAAHYAKTSPVPFAYHVEPRNGLSFARNLGVAKARHDYVAFLDDDATACTNWLTSFNSVINDHKALVVGGRVETVFDPGFVAPDWFHYQYVKGFFGINYRDWGSKNRCSEFVSRTISAAATVLTPASYSAISADTPPSWGATAKRFSRARKRISTFSWRSKAFPSTTRMTR